MAEQFAHVDLTIPPGRQSFWDKRSTIFVAFAIGMVIGRCIGFL